ncbi:MAG: hypothetical protein EXS36_14005 [Pedosphaera sp.]|nr:hypothetical protein [Pedosphaera sp.]
MMDPAWHVIHTRPRCEKKLAAYCERERIDHSLPLYRSVKRYRGKEVVFLKPLFPNYIFLRLSEPQQSVTLRRNKHVARILPVPEQPEFERQLSEILRALGSDVEVRLAPQIGVGMRVKIRSGALRGLDGWVEQRSGTVEVLLRLDFIGQAAAVKISADELEPI